MNKLNKLIKSTLRSSIIESVTPFREIEHFHPNGNVMPNGSHYQRGGFLHECKVNKDNFILNEAVHGEQYGMSKYRGGVIVFSTDVNAVQLDKNKIINKIKQFITTYRNRTKRGNIVHNTINKFNQENDEYIGAYSLGSFFKGKYVGDNGEMFNDKSLCIEINGLSSLSLLKLAEMIAKTFMQETVLVKDLNLNKIYLADSLESDTDFDQEMERINSEC